jgi:putative transposase
MAYDAEAHHRSSARLKTFDYTSNAAYFITVCANVRANIFGEIVDGEMQLNDSGRIVWECWNAISEHFPHVELDAFIAMPDHVHGIVLISQPSDKNERGTVVVGATHASPLRPDTALERPNGPKKRSLGSIIGSFKSAASKRINESRGLPGTPIWQRNYWDRVIRDDRELEETRKYILENPARSFERLVS